jgi:hypothetical protein
LPLRKQGVAQCSLDLTTEWKLRTNRLTGLDEGKPVTRRAT